MDFQNMWNDYKNAPVMAAQPEDLEKSRVFAILSYIWILFFLPLVCCKDSPFGKFHSNQGLLLLIASAIAGAALTSVSLILSVIPVLGWIISGLVNAAAGLAILGLMIVGILNAAAGEYRRLPFIGGFDLIK